ncbi:MAG: ribosome recycling factor [Patescibacteria group bacterium]|nr:ribosome recycling factor [Patescibacteria group bacterium]
MSQFIESFNEDFNKVVKHFQEDIEKLKAGRAHPSMIEDIFVECYGVKTPLKQVASISIPESSLLQVEPWDKTVIKEVEKALSSANLDLSVSVAGNIVRAKIPALTEEKRKQTIKILNEKKEDAKVIIRQIREKIKKEIERQEKDKEISQDEKFSFIEELDKVTKDKSTEIDNISKAKEEDTMKI